MIKGVIFDLDGVITDTAEYHYLAWKNLADSQGWKFDREANEELRGVSRMDSIRLIARNNSIDLSEDEMVQFATAKNEIYVKSLENISPDDYLPGAEELLKRIKDAGLKIGLGSSSKNARPVLKKLQAEQYFDMIGDGNSVNVSKPDPGIFLFGASELGLDPSECIVFEDAESGIDAALAGGFPCVGIGPEERVGHATVRFDDMNSASFDEIAEFFAISQQV